MKEHKPCWVNADMNDTICNFQELCKFKLKIEYKIDKLTSYKKYDRENY